MKLIKTTISTALLTLLLTTNAVADCSYELFSISSTKNTKIIDFVEQLSDECEFSIIVTDPNVEKFLNSKLNKTNLNNLTINEVLNIVLKENNLSYSLENNLLKISYLKTKMFNIDYILSTRKSMGKTDITLSSEGAGIAQQGGGAQQQTQQTAEGELSMGGGGAGKAGVSIESEDEVEFWHELDLELQKVLNRPQDVYKADAPIINKNAGIITVTATYKQINRLEQYLKKLQEKVQLQVLIDVQMLSVQLDNTNATGVDWKQLWALQDITVNYSADKTNPSSGSSSSGSLISMTGSGTLSEVIKFLDTQGDVSAISNPKVLTLNNQPALVTAGTEYFYKITSTETIAGGNTGTQSENESINSVFAGVLLDITPEIADNGDITLKVNPSLSQTVTDVASVAAVDRTMPPDLDRRQLSSVVTVKDGNRVILGGLINTKDQHIVNKVPILGDIPIVNYLFKYEENIKVTHELVIVMEPHIVQKNKDTLSLSDLGYAEYSDDILHKNMSASEITAKALKGDFENTKKEEDEE